ncbi:MAG: DNA repair protein RecO [Clostridia bacterium]|nr:DNA repair protein RecO [Clostridia bacterium]
MEFTAKALVLSERAVGEWDKSLTLLCEGVGKIQAWAKGAKRVKSPLLGASSLFCYGSYVFSERGERITVQSAAVEESHFELRGSVERLALAAYLCELCKTLAPERQPEDELLHLTLNALYALSKALVPFETVKPAFELRAMACSGFLPELEGCAVCARSEGPLWFSSLQGGVLCERHAAAKDAISLSPAALAAMRYLCSCDPKRLYSFRMSKEAMRELTQRCEEFVAVTLTAALPTLEFYKRVTAPLSETPPETQSKKP